MAMNPLIGTLFYEDKLLKIKIPLRLRLAKFVSNSCENCNLHGTVKDLQKAWEIEEVKQREAGKPPFQWVKSNNQQLLLPSQAFKNNELLCVNCKKPLKEVVVEKIVVYAKNKKQYLDLVSLLRQTTTLHNLKKEFNRFNGLTDVVCYYDYNDQNIKAIYHGCSWVNNYYNNNWPYKARFKRKQERVTKTMLEEAWKEKQKKKVAKLL